MKLLDGFKKFMLFLSRLIFQILNEEENFVPAEKKFYQIGPSQNEIVQE